MGNGTYDQQLQNVLRSYEDKLHDFLMRYYDLLYPKLNFNILKVYMQNDQTSLLGNKDYKSQWAHEIVRASFDLKVQRLPVTKMSDAEIAGMISIFFGVTKIVEELLKEIDIDQA